MSRFCQAHLQLLRQPTRMETMQRPDQLLLLSTEVAKLNTNRIEPVKLSTIGTGKRPNPAHNIVSAVFIQVLSQIEMCCVVGSMAIGVTVGLVFTVVLAFFVHRYKSRKPETTQAVGSEIEMSHHGLSTRGSIAEQAFGNVRNSIQLASVVESERSPTSQSRSSEETKILDQKSNKATFSNRYAV